MRLNEVGSKTFNGRLNWFRCCPLFHIDIEGKGGWIIGRAKGYVGPLSQIIGGGPGPPLPTPMNVALK